MTTAITRRSALLATAAAFAAQGQDPEEVAWLGLAEAARRIRSRALTSTRLVEACLARIDTYQPKLNTFITVLRERAFAQAALDREQQAGKFRGPLHGIPIALKDNVDTAGVRTTAG